MLSTICSENTLNFLNSLPRTSGIPFEDRFQNFQPSAIELLKQMLVWDPKIRISASEALKQPFLESYHDPQDEPESGFLFDWSLIDKQQSIDDWKLKMKEASHFY